MGGDRDGNPNVTSTCTRDVVILGRLEAVNFYFRAVEQLMFDLSIWRCSPELKVRRQGAHSPAVSVDVHCAFKALLVMQRQQHGSGSPCSHAA
jgi:phosphoenolpyruvate carboxylase